MKILSLFLILALVFSSCMEDSGKYTGTFRNINPRAFPPQMSVQHLKGDKFRINYNDIMVDRGIKKRNRIIAIMEDNPIDQDTIFYDYSPDCNTISKTSVESNTTETYIRVR